MGSWQSSWSISIDCSARCLDFWLSKFTFHPTPHPLEFQDSPNRSLTYFHILNEIMKDSASERNLYYRARQLQNTNMCQSEVKKINITRWFITLVTLLLNFCANLWDEFLSIVKIGLCVSQVVIPASCYLHQGTLFSTFLKIVLLLFCVHTRRATKPESDYSHL